MTHPLDGNTHAINRYLANMDHQVGEDEGDECGRYPEPDEDAPRGYRPKPCGGVMEADECGCCVRCSTCGEYA